MVQSVPKNKTAEDGGGDSGTVTDHAASQRKAAFPRVAHGGSRYHVLNTLGMAQCGTRRALWSQYPVPVAQVPLDRRCASAGCAQRWPIMAAGWSTRLEDHSLHVASPDGRALCDPAIVLQPNTLVVVNAVSRRQRCVEPGCRQHWPALARKA